MPRQARKTTTKSTKKPKEEVSYFDKLEAEVQSNQSKLSLVLGALIVLVVGILIWNYFHKEKPEVGPSTQTQQNQQVDVPPTQLPGKYTVKEGDTLFLVAEKYYQDGDKFTEIAKANNLSDVNSIETGQVLEIPKLEANAASPETSPTPSESATPAPTESGTVLSESPTTQEVNLVPLNEKGANPVSLQIQNPQNFGSAITGDTYIVQEGDWLSKISARAYGDMMLFNKIAAVNGITNPDLIIPGQVLKIPR